MLQEPSSEKLEQTLAIIKPDAVKNEDEIVVRIQKAGFTVSNVGAGWVNSTPADRP